MDETSTMPVGKLSAALVEAFGRQAMHVARQLQEQILSGPLEKALKHLKTLAFQGFSGARTEL